MSCCKELETLRGEMSVDECDFEAADEACSSHSSDAAVFCGVSDTPTFKDGALRTVGVGAPALPGEAGRLEMFSSVNGWVPVCKQGFSSGMPR